MKKVAVFGNTGGGKSSLSKQLAKTSGLPLYHLDQIQYQSGGVEVPTEDFKQAHQMILETNQWIIDGFGSLDTLWLRLDKADTLIFIDLPLYLHFWWVTKRLVTGYFELPEGWPERSPIFKSSLTSYRVLWLCHKRLTPKYRQFIEQSSSSKRVYHLQSSQQITKFFELMKTRFKSGTSA